MTAFPFVSSNLHVPPMSAFPVYVVFALLGVLPRVFSADSFYLFVCMTLEYMKMIPSERVPVNKMKLENLRSLSNSLLSSPDEYPEGSSFWLFGGIRD